MLPLGVRNTDGGKQQLLRVECLHRVPAHRAHQCVQAGHQHAHTQSRTIQRTMVQRVIPRECHAVGQVVQGRLRKGGDNTRSGGHFCNNTILDTCGGMGHGVLRKVYGLRVQLESDDTVGRTRLQDQVRSVREQVQHLHRPLLHQPGGCFCEWIRDMVIV